MKTLTKLTLTTVAAMALGATTLLAGPGGGPYGPQYGAVPNARPAHEVRTPVTLTCKTMAVNRNPKLGGPTTVACTKAIKDTAACRMACR